MKHFREYFLDENRKNLQLWPPDADYITFHNPSLRTIDETRLKSWVQVQPCLKAILGYCISQSSGLTSAWPSTIFPNAQSIYLAGNLLSEALGISDSKDLRELIIGSDAKNRIAMPDISQLRLKRLMVSQRNVLDLSTLGCGDSLEELGVYHGTFTDMNAIELFSANKIVVVGGSLRHLMGMKRVRHELQVHNCRYLTSLAGCRTSQLTIASSSNTNLETLAGNEYLKSLTVTAHSKIESLEFVRRCPALFHLSISASHVKKKDVTAILESPTLEAVVLSQGFSDKVLRDLTKVKPGLIASNLRRTFLNGTIVDRSVYYQHLGNRQA